MKSLILIVFLLIGYTTFAQEIPKEYRKANTMSININGDQTEFLNKIVKSLIYHDYEIESLDKEFFLISTKPLLVKNVLNTFIKVKLTETKAEFQNYTSMELNVSGVNTKGYSLTNFRGQKGSPNYEASMKLFQIVSSLSPQIEYLEK